MIRENSSRLASKCSFPHVGGVEPAVAAHPNSIILAIYGYHLRKICEKYVV